MKMPFVAVALLLLADFAHAQAPGKDAKVYEVGKEGLKIDGKLTKDDPLLLNAPLAELKGAPHKVFQVKLQQGQHYIVELRSDDFDAFLILEDAGGNRLAFDDDSGGGFDARILFTPKAEGLFRLSAATFARQSGQFHLTVRSGVLSPEEKLGDEAMALNQEAVRLRTQHRLPEAVAKLRKMLEICQKAYPESKFPDGHRILHLSLYNLGTMLMEMGSFAMALPYSEEALAMSRRLYPAAKYPHGHQAIAQSAHTLAAVFQGMGTFEKAVFHVEEALAIARKLFPESKYPDGHPLLATYLTDLTNALRIMQAFERALPFSEEAVAICRRLYPASKYSGGHPDLADALSNHSLLLEELGLTQSALSHCEQALLMRQRLYQTEENPNGHPSLAASLSDLGDMLYAIGQKEKAQTCLQQSLDMNRKLYPVSKYPNGHPDLAISLSHLARVLYQTDQKDKALSILQEDLELRRRLYPRSKYPEGHPHLADALSNLGVVLNDMGQSHKALDLFRECLDIRQKFYSQAKYPDGHRAIVTNLNNLGNVHESMGQVENALKAYEQAVQMRQKLNDRMVSNASGETALTLLAQLRSGSIDDYLSLALRFSRTENDSFRMVWNEKATVQRLLSRRHLAAIAARHHSPEVRKAFDNLDEVQSAIGRLLTNPVSDITSRNKRLAELSEARDRLTRTLTKALPAVERDREPDTMSPRDLIKLMPDQTVLIDLLDYEHWENGKKTGPRYLAFILGRFGDQAENNGNTGLSPKSSIQSNTGSVKRIEIGDKLVIDQAIREWRNAIESRTTNAAAGRLRELIWAKMAQHIPIGTKTLYICSAGDLARLPWAALPVAKDRVLLEEYALAALPYGRFLLEQLKYQPAYATRESVFALGNVHYGADAWPLLPGTAMEMKGLQDCAAGRAIVQLTGKDGTYNRVRDALPQARFAHFATHGYFDAQALTKERKREMELMTNRKLGDDSQFGVATKNALGYVGLVLADNDILDGLSLINLPLENLKLVTLSACETGLGAYTAGEGVQGLQRAFHVAGCPNVVASLWKVNDAATAALMTKFYHEMWIKKKPPIEALREAQLFIYRNPDLIPILASDRGRPLLDKAAPLPETPAAGAKRTDTKLWAAFVLSGVGR